VLEKERGAAAGASLGVNSHQAPVGHMLGRAGGRRREGGKKKGGKERRKEKGRKEKGKEGKEKKRGWKIRKERKKIGKGFRKILGNF
jgi:hypothetical protein